MNTLSKHVIVATLAGASALTLTSAVQAQTRQAGSSGASKKALVWGPAPNVFPPGAKMAVESGNPMATGEFVVRFAFPNGYRIPPHWHPTDEHVQVRSGTFYVGMGDQLDANKTMKMTPGDTGTVGATMHHFAIARGETVVSVRAMGPFAMTYVNPADDPRKR